MREKNNVQNTFLEKFLEMQKKGFEAICLEALISLVEVVGIEPATS